MATAGLRPDEWQIVVMLLGVPLLPGTPFPVYFFSSDFLLAVVNSLYLLGRKRPLEEYEFVNEAVPIRIGLSY